MATNKKHIAVYTLFWDTNANRYYWRRENGQTSKEFRSTMAAAIALADYFEIEWKGKTK